MEVDDQGNIIILDGDTSEVDIIPAGQTSPSKEVSVAGFPFEMSLNKKEKAVSMSTDTTDFIIQSFKYPKGSAASTQADHTDDGRPLAVSPDAVL
jgi:hypothetical protein